MQLFSTMVIGVRAVWLGRTAAPIVDEIERTGRLDDAGSADLKATLSALAAQVGWLPGSEPRTK